MIGTKYLLAAGLVVCVGVMRAQQGSNDVSFNPDDQGFGLGTGADYNGVSTTVVQSDGKIIIGGGFFSYNGVPHYYIARLNADGTVDATFGTGAGANQAVHAVAIQPDGKIIIGGVFTTYDGAASARVARLNDNGSLDNAFDPGTGLDDAVRSIAIQADGKILLGGEFTTYNGVGRSGIARLNTDGSLDAGFNPGTGVTLPDVKAIVVQPDGKILIGGQFSSYNGTARNGVARLNTDGSVDTGFNPGTGVNGGEVFSIQLQPDGKVILGGSFATFNGTNRDDRARLNANGTLDVGFVPVYVQGSYVRSIALQPDGKILVGGGKLGPGASVILHISRLNADGSLDASYDQVTGAQRNSWATSLTLQADGKLVVGGDFICFPGVGHRYISRVNADGGADMSFNPGHAANLYLNTTAVDADGNILIGGRFSAFDAICRNGTGTLDTDGAWMGTFEPELDPFSEVHTIIPLASGKVFIGGSFSIAGSTGGGSGTWYDMARLEQDGRLDTSFHSGFTNGGWVYAAAILPNGKFIVAGYFTSYGGQSRNRIFRMDANGNLDAAFDPGTGASSAIYSIAVQPDGKIIIGGSFTSYNGTARNRIARLNSDGSLDSGFIPGTGASSIIYSVARQPDGKVVIGGQFTSYNGTSRNRIARLNADGSLDAGFIPGTGIGGTSPYVNAAVFQADGKILIGGRFTSYNGTLRNSFARLNTNGSLDAGFNTGTGANGPVNSISLQPDGKIIIGGNFTSYNGTGRNRIARINGTARTSIKLMLEGPYSGGMMTDALRTLPSFPLTEPFSAMGYAETSYVPGASIPASLLSDTGSNAIVDWVLVEMRPVATPNVVAASRAVLLQRDGDVVDLDGVSTVGFAGLAAGSYCIAVKPRTHLPVMLSTSTPVIYGDAIATADFTLPSTQVYDTDALKNIGGVMVLATGDAVFNENIQYTGTNNDRDPILTRIGGSVPTATASGYWPEDVNMDGIVKYVGANNDRDPILVNVGGSTPTAVRHAELP